VREGKTKALDSSRCNCGAYLTLSRDESSLAYKIQTANIGPPSHNHPLSAPVGEHVKMTLSQVGQDALQDLAILQQCDVPVAGMKRFVLLVRVLYDAGSWVVFCIVLGALVLGVENSCHKVTLEIWGENRKREYDPRFDK
jgi:hypothetical protein